MSHHNKIKIHNARQRIQKLQTQVSLLHLDIVAHLGTSDGRHKDKFKNAAMLTSSAAIDLAKAIDELQQ